MAVDGALVHGSMRISDHVTPQRFHALALERWVPEYEETNRRGKMSRAETHALQQEEQVCPLATD